MKITGKTSWFGGPNDNQNTGTALGLPDTTRGLAVYNRSTLGGYWRVHWPNGRVSVERQVDIGPAPWTNRKIDFTSAALKANGYTEQNFPTDSQATIEYLGKNASVAQQAQDSSQSAQQSGVAAARSIAPKGLLRDGFTQSLIKNSVTTVQPAQEAQSSSQPAQPDTSVKGSRNFEGTPVAAWIYPILVYARGRGWKGSLNSGVRSFADQTRIWNSGVRPAARPGTSNHEMTAFPGGAIDVNGAQQLHQILQGSPYKNILVWAGAKDPVHFSHPHGGSY